MSAAGMGAVVSRAMEDEGFRREFMGNPFAVLDGWDLTSQEVRDLIFWLPLRLAQVDDAGEGYGKADQRIVFRDRRDAGRQLAGRLLRYRDDHPIVLALPRGGVPVGYEVARVLEAPLDVLVVRKLCAPGHTDFGIGAIAPGGMRVLDDQAIRLLGMGEAEIEQIAAAELAEMERYLRRFCSDRPPRRVRDRTVILVDDGLATGITARAAIQVIRQQQPSRIVLSLPVCPLKVAHRLRAEVEEVITVVSPQQLGPVSFWYAAFDQTSDEEVVALLDSAWGWRTGHAGRQTEERVVTVPADGVQIGRAHV